MCRLQISSHASAFATLPLPHSARGPNIPALPVHPNTLSPVSRDLARDPARAPAPTAPRFHVHSARGDAGGVGEGRGESWGEGIRGTGVAPWHGRRETPFQFSSLSAGMRDRVVGGIGGKGGAGVAPWHGRREHPLRDSVSVFPQSLCAGIPIDGRGGRVAENMLFTWT
jgi:hypothetical protein